jgi:hypothetical protein
LRRHVENFPEYGIDPELYSDLHTFRNETKKLLLAAGSTVEAELVEDEEEPSSSVGSPTIVCGWGSINEKYNAATTNHYFNMPVTPNVIEDEQQQSSSGQVNIKPSEGPTKIKMQTIALKKKKFDEWIKTQDGTSGYLEGR